MEVQQGRVPDGIRHMRAAGRHSDTQGTVDCVRLLYTNPRGECKIDMLRRR